MRIGVEVFHELRYTLLARGRGVLIGADGGFAPDLESNESALETLVAAITAAGYEPGWDVWIGIDAAATQLRQDGRYALAHEGRDLSADDLAGYYDELADRYPVLLLEDGMAEDDWEGWQRAHRAPRPPAGARRRRCFRDQPGAASGGSPRGSPSDRDQAQSGRDAHRDARDDRVAQASGYATVIAQRSGETEDTSICDLAVATGSVRSRPAPPRGSAWPSTTGCSASRRCSAPEAKFAGLSAFYPDGGRPRLDSVAPDPGARRAPARAPCSWTSTAR